jgi:hypothetical protein
VKVLAPVAPIMNSFFFLLNQLIAIPHAGEAQRFTSRERERRFTSRDLHQERERESRKE